MQIRITHLATLACALWLLTSGAMADDNITKADYDSITETKSSVVGEEPAQGPKAVHDFSDKNSADVKNAGGKRMLKDKEWIGKTPEERDAYIRDLRSRIPVNVRIVLTVPNGEIWLIPVVDYVLLSLDDVIRQWTHQEQQRLPTKVAQGDSHSDIRGAGPLAVAVKLDF
jgi:hypothetical protein